MSGRKTFVGGDILLASEVNGFLMDQAVMVFDDASDRTTNIPSPSEGMVTYRKDQDIVEVFDGSNYKPVGGLVDVKSAIFTGTQSASVTAGSNVAVTSLSITHTVSDAANKLIISAFIGSGGSSSGFGVVGLAIDDGSGLIAVGNSAGDRTRLTAGGLISPTSQNQVVSMPSVTFVHTPGAGSKTYTVRAVNIASVTSTVYVNRNETDANNENNSRAVSSLVIQEVAV